MPAGGFDAAAKLLGRMPVAHIAQGGALTEGALANGLAASIQSGERAIAVRVDESNAVSNLVKPGDTVDVFVVMKRDAADGEIPATHARLLLSRVRVLCFGDSTTPTDANATRAAARTAVLAVHVDDVDSLSLAENSGRLLLALRNPADADTYGDNTAVSAQAQSPLARAATGVSLDALSGRAAAVARFETRANASVPMLPPLPSTFSSPSSAISPPRPRTHAATGGTEVIRGATRENIPNN
jgi:pilus assembly protein CpaB